MSYHPIPTHLSEGMQSSESVSLQVKYQAKWSSFETKSIENESSSQILNCWQWRKDDWDMERVRKKVGATTFDTASCCLLTNRKKVDRLVISKHFDLKKRKSVSAPKKKTCQLVWTFSHSNTHFQCEIQFPYNNISIQHIWMLDA